MKGNSVKFPIWFKDNYGDDICLTKERWQHIEKNHPIATKCFDYIPNVLQDPEVVQKGFTNKNEFRFYKRIKHLFGNNWVMVVVVKDRDAKFIVTVFVVDLIRKGGEFLCLRKN